MIFFDRISELINWRKKRDFLKLELEKAKQELILTEQNFKYATNDYVEVAVLDLEKARKRYSALLREYKEVLRNNEVID
ncbi:MAG: hypothetical protein H0Z24_05765 [Thermosipho sp. (in: Bacteria)]|nr:hypothetical protein [Thermosipho sp. (in: thermotogales)]